MAVDTKTTSKSLETVCCSKCGKYGQKKIVTHTMQTGVKHLYEIVVHYGKEGNARLRYHAKYHSACYIGKVS